MSMLFLVSKLPMWEPPAHYCHLDLHVTTIYVMSELFSPVIWIFERLYFWIIFLMTYGRWKLDFGAIFNVVISLVYNLLLFWVFVILLVIYSEPPLFINEVTRINNWCHESQMPNFSHVRRFKNHARVNLVSDLVILKFLLVSRFCPQKVFWWENSEIIQPTKFTKHEVFQFGTSNIKFNTTTLYFLFLGKWF